MQLLAGTEHGWTTLQHAEPGSTAELTGFGPGSSFAVRLVAQNAHGAAPPSESTAITPGPFGGCNSERTWTAAAAFSPSRQVRWSFGSSIQACECCKAVLYGFTMFEPLRFNTRPDPRRPSRSPHCSG